MTARRWFATALLLIGCKPIPETTDDPSVVELDVDTPTDLAIGEAGLFWSTSPLSGFSGGSGGDSLFVATQGFDGGTPIELATLPNGNGVNAIWVDGAHAYWLDAERDALLESALDGSGQQALVQLQNDGPAQNTRLLEYGGALWFGGTRGLYRTPLDGGETRIVITPRFPFSQLDLVAVNDTGAYWTELGVPFTVFKRAPWSAIGAGEPLDAGPVDAGAPDAGGCDAGSVGDAGDDGGSDAGNACAPMIPPEHPGVIPLGSPSLLSAGAHFTTDGRFVYWFESTLTNQSFLVRVPIEGPTDAGPETVFQFFLASQPDNPSFDGQHLFFTDGSPLSNGIYEVLDGGPVALFRGPVTGDDPRLLRFDDTHVYWFGDGVTRARLHKLNKADAGQ